MSLSLAWLCGADKTRVRLPDWEHFFSWRTRGLGPTRRLTGMGTPLAVPGPGIYDCIESYAGSSNFLPWITLVKETVVSGRNRRTVEKVTVQTGLYKTRQEWYEQEWMVPLKDETGM